MKLQHKCVLFGGREFVTVAEIPQLLADAVFPGDPDSEVAGQFGAAVRKQYAIDTEYPRALRDAISAGELVSKSAAGVPYAPGVGAMRDARVSVDDFALWAAQFGIRVVSSPQKPSPSAAMPPPAGGAWLPEAREIAREEKAAHPRLSLDQLSEKVEAKLRERGITGRGGRVPRAGTIRRRAFKDL